MKALALLAGIGCVPTVFAHYNWRALIVNGSTTPDFRYVRRNTNLNDFVSMTSLDFRCDVGSQASAKSTQVATVEAGGKVGMTNIVGAAHIGPVMFYMSKAPNGDVTTYDGSGDWFKIYEIGPTVAGGRLSWTTNNMASFTFNIPKDIPDGQYLLRGERLALHIANQPQWYVGCAHLNVVGGGNAIPGATIKVPGGYKSGDPNIFLNPYGGGITAYRNPGPAIFTG